MHELSIALNLLDIAEEESKRQGDVVVRTIRVKLGPLSGVVKEALESAFELAREQSTLSEARLQVEEMPIIVRCDVCNAERALASIQLFACPVCGTPTSHIIGGREMELSEMEVEDRS